MALRLFRQAANAGLARALGALVLLGIGVALALGAPPIIVYPGGTPEESAQLQLQPGADVPGQSMELERLQKIVREHPANRPARVLKLLQELNMGEIQAAKEDLDYLGRNSPSFYGVSGARLLLLEALGDLEGLTKAYREILENQPTDSTAKAFWSMKLPLYKARALEGEGKLDEAKTLLDAELAASKGLMKVSRQRWLGEFLLRTGKFKEAAVAMANAAELKQAGTDSWIVNRNDMAVAAWADGRPQEALKIYRATIDEAPRAKSGESYPGAIAVCGYYALAQALDGEADKAAAKAYVEGIMGKVPPDNLYSGHLAALVFAGKVELPKAEELLTKVLKEAPRLDWALWASTFIGLSGGEESAGLLKLLPPGSIQKQVAAVAAAVAASQPASQAAREK